MTTRCPACDCSHWEVSSFSGGERQAVETRECQGCGHTWTEAFTR